MKRTAARSGAVALIDDKRSLTFSELDLWSRGLAGMRQAAGGTELPVGILAPSSTEFAAALLATWLTGSAAVPLQPRYPVPELVHILKDAGSRVVWVHPQQLERARELQKHHSFEILPIEPRNHSLAFTPRPASSDSPALLIYTSGTTSKPKGAVWSHSALDRQIHTLVSAWRWTEGDQTLCVLPLNHVHGLVNILFCSLASGARCSLAERFDAELTWKQIAAGALTVFMAVPAVYSQLLSCWEHQCPETRANWSAAASRLRLFVSGSQALPLSLLKQWQQLSGHTLLERYGMTEIGMAISNPYEGERRPATVGVPLPGVEVRLVDEQGLVLQTSAATGEIQVRGPQLFSGYWNSPVATAQCLTSDCWFRTGDIAERTADGYFRILGRSSQDIIKTGGFKVSALEIESVLLEHPAIAEVAVVSFADAGAAEKIAAACVIREGHDADNQSIRDFLAERIAHYKIPTLWKWVAQLPRNALGKPLKPEIRAWFSAGN